MPYKVGTNLKLRTERSRTFRDSGVTIRIKAGKYPHFKLSFEYGGYLIRWRGEHIGYSQMTKYLRKELNEWLVFLWTAYAKDDTSPMTPGAKRLKRLMLEYFEEI